MNRKGTLHTIAWLCATVPPLVWIMTQGVFWAVDTYLLTPPR